MLRVIPAAIAIPIWGGGVKKKEFINFVQQMWTTTADQLPSSGEKFSLYHKFVCVCVRMSQAPLPIQHAWAPSTKSSVSVSKLEMPISLYTAPYLIFRLPSSHHLAHV